MEILNKTMIRTFIVLLSLFVATIAKAQDYKAIQEAFASSYSLEKAEKYSAAVEVLKKVYDESSYELNVRLGWLSYMAGSFVESTTYYNRAIKLKPYSVEARLGFVYPAAALGNWELVINRYNEILKVDAGNYTSNYRLGGIYYTRKDYATAYKYFEKLVNMYPFDYDALHMFAWTNFQMGKLREAKVLFNKALMNHPADASCLEGLSLIK